MHAARGVAQEPPHPLLVSECLCFPLHPDPGLSLASMGILLWGNGHPAVGRWASCRGVTGGQNRSPRQCQRQLSFPDKFCRALVCFRLRLPAQARERRPAAALPLPLVWLRLSSSVLVLCSKMVSPLQEKMRLSDKEEAARPQQARGGEGARWLVGHGGTHWDTSSQWDSRGVPTRT